MGDRSRIHPLPAAIASIGLVAAGGLMWSSLIERKLYTLRRVDVPLLPAGAEPIRVLHLADLHMAPWQRDKQDWIRALADLEPDLIVDTGDNLGHVNGLEGVERAFERFTGIPGVFVNGSNDYFGPTPKNPLKYFTAPSGPTRQEQSLNTDAMLAFFAELGWHDLNNAAASLDLNGTHVEFFGVNDAHRHFDKLELLTGAIDEMRESDTSAGQDSRAALTIGVTHAPYQRVLNSFVTHGAELIFAGHTHGGQVCIPGFGALVTNCDIPRRQVKGLSVWHHAFRSAYLNVSAGLGTSIYAPVRFACPPEATLLTLVPAF